MDDGRTMRTIDARTAAPPTAVPSTSERILATASGLMRSVRPRQWTKNLLVFAAAGAAGSLLRPHVLGRSAVAFVALCLISSAGYIFNDLIDAPTDRLHPRRSARPIAAGLVPVAAAATAAVILAAAAMAVSAMLGPAFLATVGIYAVLA